MRNYFPQYFFIDFTYCRTPPQLMMTKVFALRSRSAGVNFCDREFSSSRLNDSTDSLYIDSRNSSPNEEPSRKYCLSFV